MNKFYEWLAYSFGVLVAIYIAGLCGIAFVALVYQAVHEGSKFAACTAAIVVVAMIIGAYLVEKKHEKDSAP